MYKFKLIDHTADIGIRTSATSLEELFCNCAYGMYNIICENFHNIEEKEKYSSSTEDQDVEGLLISFLNDLLYQTSVNKILFCKFKVEKITNEDKSWKISYTCFGEKYDKQKHGALFELKSATFHNLKIKKNKNGYSVDVIFDI
ncbi:MAG: archease [Endomicrobiia bacterium]